MAKLTEDEIQARIDAAIALERREAAAYAATAVDGRYRGATEPVLKEVVSEHALMRNRFTVMVKWLIFQLEGKFSKKVPIAEGEDIAFLESLIDDYTVADTLAIQEFEKTTQHDVKAVEYHLRAKMAEKNSLLKYRELTHITATSEDVNSAAYAMMVRQLRTEVIIPELHAIERVLAIQAYEGSNMPMLALTHGQPAVPQVLGKTMAVPAARLYKQIDDLESLEETVKWGGATGNFNAMMVADPEVDPVAVGDAFVESLGFTRSPLTTQIEPFDWLTDFSYKMAHIDRILYGVSVDTWLRIMLEQYGQEPEAGTTGSSTMPHKINPIRFENAEGNFEKAIDDWEFLGRRLGYSRLERDLSGSTVARGLGAVSGLQVVAMVNLQKGLARIKPNSELLLKQLQDKPEILTEAIQTVMRINSIVDDAPDSYAIVKDLSRGKKFTREDYLAFVNDLELDAAAKKQLVELLAETYIGLSPELARMPAEKLGLIDNKGNLKNS